MGEKKEWIKRRKKMGKGKISLTFKIQPESIFPRAQKRSKNNLMAYVFHVYFTKFTAFTFWALLF